MEALGKAHAWPFRPWKRGFAVLLFAMLPVSAQEPSPDLYAQAMQVMLDRSFPSQQVEYVLLDARTRKTIAMLGACGCPGARRFAAQAVCGARVWTDAYFGWEVSDRGLPRKERWMLATGRSWVDDAGAGPGRVLQCVFSCPG